MDEIPSLDCKRVLEARWVWRTSEIDAADGVLARHDGLQRSRGIVNNIVHSHERGRSAVTSATVKMQPRVVVAIQAGFEGDELVHY